ncbi:MAG TPA: zf-HC2 domain-containing protein [Blastocatellia bacterium]|nr:zf-HC2 domain-containing protein [Blastocatellia bacterium]
MTQKNKQPECGMREALVSYLYGEATPDESRRFAAHLKECAACAEELAAFDRVRGALRQWELDDAPVFHFSPSPSETPAARRPFLAVLRELFGVMPVWTKAVGAMAMAVLVLAVLGTEIKVENGNFSLRMDLLRRSGVGPQKIADNQGQGDLNMEPLRAQIRNIVHTMIAESERRRDEEVRAMLVGFESQLQNMKSAELSRLAERVEEHNRKIRTLERDIDRRDELDLTDILFSELQTPPADRAGAEGGR